MAPYDNLGNRRKGKQSADLYKLDTRNKTPEENIKDIIQGLYIDKKQNDTSPTNKNPSVEPRLGLRGVQRNESDGRRLSYLNALVTLLAKEDRNNLGFTPDELMTCIRISLVDESIVIRAAALRVLRYLIKTESDVATFNNLKLPYLVVRSMDLMLRNEEERAQALRVVRRVIAIVGASGQIRRHRAAYVDPGLLRCLTAVARAGSAGDGTGDRLSRPAIATLAEICVLNPDMFISCGGVNAVIRQLSECATPRMAEALCGVLLHTLNDPVSRQSARIDLMCLSSPYCDFHFRPAGTETSRDEREMRFTCSRLALLCVLRSWPGLLHFCHPYRAGGLRALVSALYLPRLEVRKAILDLLYELVGLPQPEWTDEISVALGAVDPSDFQDSWRLSEGFVAEEGIAILPHLGATGPDITEIHLALLLRCFLEAGLVEGLAEVIVSSDTFISVRGTVLLGAVVAAAQRLVPGGGGAGAALAGAAARGAAPALAAVAALRRAHATLAARPAAASLFLDHVLRAAAAPPAACKSRKEADNVLARGVSARTSAAVSRVTRLLFDRDRDALLRASLVLASKDGNTWNWEIIRTVLKENDGPPFLNLNDNGHRGWAARIVSYLRPSSNKYSHADLTSSVHGHAATRAGCQLIRHLLRHNDADSQKLLESLFNDVSRQIEAIETGLKAHECLFSPQHMCNTMCQMYFLFIGQLCHSHVGLNLFKQTRLYENLLDLSTKTHLSCYVKLVISSLDYTLDSYPRDILAKTLTCNIQASRLYTTQFLNVLLRASRKGREIVRRKSKLQKNYDYKLSKEENDSCGDDMEAWILKMLVGQVKDESKEIVRTTLDILEEACTVPVLVDKMMLLKSTFGENCGLDKNMEPSTLDFHVIGDRAYMLWFSLEAAAAVQAGDAKSMAFLKKHLDFWTKSYNYRYVSVVEGAVQGALRGVPRGPSRGARPPPHAHAALAPAPPPRLRHLLHHHLHHHYKILQRKKCSNEQEVVDLKASLWALGNTALSPQGLQLLMNLSNGYLEDSVLVHIIRVTKYCPVYAARATAFYVLSLIGSTYDGANLLSELGWLCVRHTRHDQFPVIPDETLPLSEGIQSCVTSPDRFATYDAEASEFSDHTDQSIAESLPSDTTKLSKTVLTDHTDQDMVDYKHYPDKKEQDKRKSHTLPSHGCSSSQDRPMLSESKTVDILKDASSYDRHHRMAGTERLLIGRMNSLDAHEGRIRNTSESSTSGVSSCDSFLGKYAIPDRVLTLSPIPSSSSLYGMKSSNSTQRPKMSSELQRRTSTSSFAGHEVASSSPPSQMDMTGYATLKSINRRPHLSESAATGSRDIDDLSWLLTDSNRRQKPFSSLRDRAKSTRERINKMSLLEYDWKPLCGGEAGGARAAPGPRRAAAARPPRPRAAPAYTGICLPKDLMDIFPRDDDEKEDELGKGDIVKRGRLPSFLADTSIASIDNKSRATPDSQKISSRGMSTNVRTGFAVSSTPNAKNKHHSDPSKTEATESTKEKIDTEETNDKSDDTAKNDTSDSDVTKTEDNTNSKNNGERGDASERAGVSESERAVVSASERAIVSLSEKAIASVSETAQANDKEAWRHSTADCLACARIRPPSSHELREAFFAGMDSGSNAESQSLTTSPEHDKSSPQAQLLHQVLYMSNPLYLRQSRGVLVALKQRHPAVFRSACVFSEVSALLARRTFLLSARRFVHDLFLDTDFGCFQRAPRAILASHERPR